MRSALQLPLLLLFCVLATIGNGIAEATYAPTLAPRPDSIAPPAEIAPLPPLAMLYRGDTLRVSGFAAIFEAPDSNVKIGTIVTNLTGMLPGDTLHFWYSTTSATGTADTVLKHVRKLTVRDSIFTPAPAYGKTRYFEGCVEVESGGRLSGIKWPKAGPLCWLFPFTRSERIEPSFGIERIVLRPLGPPLAEDRLASCRDWQAAHPDSSVWLSASDVNRVAVPECKTDTQLMVWQYCAFAEDTLGQPHITTPSQRVPFCFGEYEAWKSERQV